jgi:succinyl-CoA synthetase alpha subunit
VAIYLNKDSKIIVQGMTGGMGSKHTTLMVQAGSNIVGGVNARKAGTSVNLSGKDLPVFGTVSEAMAETGADVSVVFVPPAFTKDACIEAIDAGIGLLVVITEGVPVQDTAEVWAYLESPANVGIIPAQFFSQGSIGVVSKSGTLTYQIGNELKQAGLGNSSIVGIGGDPIVGSDFIDILELYENDPETELIVLVGEIGGDAEERAADYIAEHVTKPVVAYIAGFTAPPGKQMGHAGAIISGSSGTAEAKKQAFEAKGVQVGRSPSEAAAIAADTVG